MEKKFKVGLIRVLTTENKDILLAHEKLLNQYFPMLTVETKCIPDQYEGIHSPELCMLAIPKIVETAKSFRDVDMIIETIREWRRSGKLFRESRLPEAVRQRLLLHGNTEKKSVYLGLQIMPPKLMQNLSPTSF